MNPTAKVALATVFAVFCQLAASQTSSVSEDLRISQMCAKAAKDFRSQPEWKDSPQPYTFTNHFNKKLGKCLVKASSQSLVKENRRILETQHVYDAIEGTVLGGKIVVKELVTNGEPQVISIQMVRAGKILGKNEVEAAREAYEWFDTLMRD